MKQKPIFLFLFFLFGLTAYAQENMVRVLTFKQNFPTYNMGAEQSMPFLKDFNVPGMSFFRGSRSVYPYTFINDYKPGKYDREYEVVRLENEFIYVDIVPQLRGRIQGAVDKRNNWDFLYYNHVIKPAEIAVRSAWISGGLEYNHPQGHGYTQFDKISYDIKEGKDGSKTVIISEIEPVRMMKWEYEIILRPGQLYLETKGRFISMEPFPVPFLSSNNAAMHTSEEMELIYPQETYAANHGFRDMKKWPYYGNDDADWNWLKNARAQASAFVDGTGLVQDYWGVYSHDKGIDAGTVIVSDHRTAPGKKYFTWGSHDFGKQWDYFLSDEDGGYVELQQQAYFANLGYGYAILEPFEVKEFSIFWYPIKSTGGFVKATKELAINFKRTSDSKVKVVLQPTSTFKNNKIEIYKNGVLAVTQDADLLVGDIYTTDIKLASTGNDTIKVRVLDHNQNELICYANKIPEIKPEVDKLPEKKLEDYSIDQLYFKGISNYHDPYGPDAEEAFNEIFKRDSLESRANRQMGIIKIKRGQYNEAIPFLKRSLKNDHFESCYQTHVLLGYAYQQLGDLVNAHVHLVQSSRKKALLDQSLYCMAVNEVLKGDYKDARDYLAEIPISRLTHPDVFNLQSYVFKKLGDELSAAECIARTLKIDPLNEVAYSQKLMSTNDKGAITNKINFLFDRKDSTFLGSQLYQEAALFYMNLKDYSAALEVLNIAEEHFKQTAYHYPLIDYYKGYCLKQNGQGAEAAVYYKKASMADYTYVFPYRTATITVLKEVLKENPGDAVAWMYYGDLMYYLRRHDEGVAAWEKSYDLDPNNARVARNLGIGLFVKSGETDRTIPLLEQAFENSGRNRRVYNELEQMYNLTGDDLKLEKLYDQNRDIVQRSGEFALSCADFYLRKARYHAILDVLQGTYFNAIEKGAGQPLRYSRYQQAQLGLAEQLLDAGNVDEAITHLLASYDPPANLGEVKVAKPVTCRADYLLGTAYLKKNTKAQAEKYFRKAVSQEYSPLSEDVVYRAKALLQLGKKKEANQLVKSMLLDVDSMADLEEAVGLYLKSAANRFLGNGQLADEQLEMALSIDKDVVYKARFESSFVKLNVR